VVPIDFASACLYSGSYADIDFDHFIQTITAIVAPDDLNVDVTHRTDDALLILGVGTCNIKIDMSRNPMDRVGFENALLSPFLQMQNTDFGELIDNNREHMLITVGSGNGLFNGEHLAMIAGMDIGMGIGEVETQNQMELRLKLLHMTTLYICTYAKPDLIHWTQSEQMFTGDAYLSFIDEEFPLLVMLQPWIMAGDKDGELTARYVGSEQLIGTSLTLKSTPLNIPDIVQIGAIFVEYCRSIKAVPEDGHTMGREEEWIAQIHRPAPTEDTPSGGAELTVLSHKNLKTGSQPTAKTKHPKPKQDNVVGGSANAEQSLRDAYLNRSSPWGRLSQKIKSFRNR
jgi:hypothetical protein